MKENLKKMKKKLTTINASEEEQFLNAISKCRNCAHIMMAHSFLYDDNGKCIDAFIKKDGTYIECECKKFAPADNLKYLESLYEKKQYKKKGKKK